MVIDARSAASLDVAEVDLLCAVANAPPPFPLRVPPHGTSLARRRAVLRAAGERLAARGLADERGPLGVAEAFAHLLADAPLVLDMLLSTGTDVLGAVLLARRDLAVLTTQRGAAIRVAALRLDDAVDELLDLVPAHEAALSSPFSLPTGAIGRVHRDLRARGAVDAQEWEDVLTAHGITDRLARRLSTHMQPVLGNGQVGLAARGGYAGAWRRAGDELRWLDTERGRFHLVASADGEWTSVNPMHRADLANAVRRLAGSLRG